MKKILSISLLLGLCLSLCACGSFVSLMPGTQTPEEALQEISEEFEPEMLYDFLGWDDFSRNYYQDTPIAVSYGESGEGLSPRFDRESIIKACDALRVMSVIAPLDTSADGDSRFVFTMADGSTHTVSFAGRDLDAFTGDFAVQGGDALWEIAFPGYADGFDVFDLYQSDAMRSFADNFETDTPVSVGRRVNGGALLTSQDEEVVRRAFEILKNAGIDYVEASPDQNVNLNHQEEYIFTMADGSTVTVLFTGSCLTVKVNETYGNVYYWLSGAEELLSMEILPADDSAAFEGGAITGLREDIQEAADAANGLLEDKTVIGLFVNYEIDGAEGLLSLKDERAAEFMRRFAELQVTDEKQEVFPEGDSITVSVTLSDWSGPIVSFAGDVVQETVGTWYRCDSDSFAQFRADILAAAEEQISADDDDAE